MGRFIKNYTLGPSGSYSVVLPNGTTNNDGVPTNGQVRYDKNDGSIEFYYNNKWNKMAIVGNSTIVKDQFIGDSSRTSDTMSYSYATDKAAQIIVFIGGVFQNPDVNYTVNGTIITYTSPPPLGQYIVILHNFASTLAV